MHTGPDESSEVRPGLRFRPYSSSNLLELHLKIDPEIGQDGRRAVATAGATAVATAGATAGTAVPTAVQSSIVSMVKVQSTRRY